MGSDAAELLDDYINSKAKMTQQELEQGAWTTETGMTYRFINSTVHVNGTMVDKYTITEGDEHAVVRFAQQELHIKGQGSIGIIIDDGRVVFEAYRIKL